MLSNSVDYPVHIFISTNNDICPKYVLGRRWADIFSETNAVRANKTQIIIYILPRAIQEKVQFAKELLAFFCIYGFF